jgi:hypothetical protein
LEADVLCCKTWVNGGTAMWTCECGEFNNDQASFCVACKKVRISDKKKEDVENVVHATEGMFRKIQDVILLDIALLCIVAFICFAIAVYTTFDPYYKLVAYVFLAIVVIVFQLFLLIGILRIFYSAAVNAERNTFFLQRIYELMKHEEEKPEKE